MEHPFGIDFGGTGIKGAPVDLERRLRRRADPDRHPATRDTEAVAEIFAELSQFPDSTRPVGVTVPGVVRHGVVHSAANIDKSWIGDGRRRDLHRGHRARGARGQRRRRRRPRRGASTAPRRAAADWSWSPRSAPASARRSSATACWCPTPSSVTSRSTATTRSRRAANSAREREDLSWEHWAKRLTKYYRTLEKLFSPDLFVVGGGVSKRGTSSAAHRDRDRDHPGPAAEQGRRRRRRARRHRMAGLED